MPDTPQNPYLALLQQQDTGPTWAQILQNIGNLSFGLAGGFSQAATSGQPTMAGIGPGLMMGNSMNVQSANAAEQDRLKRAEIGLKAQEYEDKRTEMLRKQKALEDFGKVGFNVTPQAAPLFGPGGTPSTGTPQPGPDLKTAGAPLVDYLVAQHGLSPVAAAAVIGNLGWESPGFNTSQSHDGGRGFGLAGWDPDRTARLQAFAAAQGKPVTDLQTQLDYAVNEMKGGTDMGAARAYAGLQQAKTPEQANAALMHFFRPQGYTPANPTGGHGFDGRVANTRALLPQQRPVDPATAPVPGVGPDPDAVPAPPPMAGPRPGLGPRVMPSGTAPDNSVPVAQGGDTGEVVLPRIGLPFPARPPVAAPPGSVPFPVIPTGPPPGATVMPGGTGVDPNVPPPAFMQTGPGGPNVVQPQMTPGPNTPAMTAGAPAGTAPPPRPVVPMPPPDPNVVARARYGLAAGVYTAEQATTMVRQDIMDKHKQAQTEAEAQYAPQLKAWEVQRTIEAEQRRQQIQIDAENRREAAKQDTYRPLKPDEARALGLPENVQYQLNIKTNKVEPMTNTKQPRFEDVKDSTGKVIGQRNVDTNQYHPVNQNTSADFAVPKDLKGDDVYQALVDAGQVGKANEIKSIVEGDSPIPSPNAKTAGAQATRDLVFQMAGPGFTDATHKQRMDMKTEMNKGKIGTALRAQGTLFNHLDHALDIASDLNNSPYPLVNRAANAIGVGGGDPRVTEMQVTKTRVNGELEKYFTGGAPTVSGLAEARDELNAAQSPAQIQAAVRTITNLVAGQQSEYLTQINRGLGYLGTDKALGPNDPLIISPEAQQARQRVIDRTVPNKADNSRTMDAIKGVTGAKPAGSSMQPTSGDPLEGRTATGPNGAKVIRRNGQWEPVQ